MVFIDIINFFLMEGSDLGVTNSNIEYCKSLDKIRVDGCFDCTDDMPLDAFRDNLNTITRGIDNVHVYTHGYVGVSGYRDLTEEERSMLDKHYDLLEKTKNRIRVVEQDLEYQEYLRLKGKFENE